MPRKPSPQPQSHACQNLWQRRCRLLAGAILVLAAILLARPAMHVIWFAAQDADRREPLPRGTLDDASRMNQTQVAEVWTVPPDVAQAEEQLTRLLKRAGKKGLPVSIAGARHSMGGHTIAPGGIVVDMTSFDAMHWDDSRQLLFAQAGATWSEIIPYLDDRGLSVAVMQSNNSFTVGGSLSVNCHGWQIGRPPIAATVESFRLMRADGAIVRCSRQENQQLFSLALGGYGLFGIILDVDLRVVPNVRYRLEQTVVPAAAALRTFDRLTGDESNAAMAYARLGIAPGRFLDDVLINVHSPAPATKEPMPDLREPGLAALRRSLFRGSADSDYGKQLRWEAETKLQPLLGQRDFSRNQLLNEGVEVFENRSAASTDILHEYFVPRVRAEQFVEDMREIIPRHAGDLLNVTVRCVEEDQDTFLRYADQAMFSFVMLFYQDRTKQADARMQAMTMGLIDAAHRAGGRYYLPYRLHATVEQFHRAYPQAQEFFTLKRTYDPGELFQSQFYNKYGGRADADRTE